jgi:hypothetical protein
MSLSEKTRLSGCGGPQVDYGLGPKSHGATFVAPGADSVHDSTDGRSEDPASSIARTGGRTFSGYGVVTSRKEAILPQPDDALA